MDQYRLEETIMLLENQLEEQSDAYSRIMTTRYRMNQSLIDGIGASEWYDLLHELVGRFVTEKPGTAIDSFWMGLSESFPWLFSPDIINEEDQLYHLIEFEREHRRIVHRLEELTHDLQWS